MTPLAHVVALPVRAYRLLISPWLGQSCRFQPTCSAYALEALERHGGSISAEHGIGLVKKPYLRSTRSDAEITVMRGIKAALDPAGILNPGKHKMHNIFSNVLVTPRDKHLLTFNPIGSICLRDGLRGQITKG